MTMWHTCISPFFIGNNSDYFHENSEYSCMLLSTIYTLSVCENKHVVAGKEAKTVYFYHFSPHSSMTDVCAFSRYLLFTHMHDAFFEIVVGE